MFQPPPLPSPRPRPGRAWRPDPHMFDPFVREEPPRAAQAPHVPTTSPSLAPPTPRPSLAARCTRGLDPQSRVIHSTLFPTTPGPAECAKRLNNEQLNCNCNKVCTFPGLHTHKDIEHKREKTQAFHFPATSPSLAPPTPRPSLAARCTHVRFFCEGRPTPGGPGPSCSSHLPFPRPAHAPAELGGQILTCSTLL